MIVSIKSAHGHFLTAEVDGTVNNSRDHTEPGPLEQWDAELVRRGVWTFRSHHGRYLAAAYGGGGEVYAQSEAKGPDEEFTVVEIPGGRIGLQTHSGDHYLSALDENYGWAVNARPTWLHEWEAFEVNPPLTLPVPPEPIPPEPIPPEPPDPGPPGTIAGIWSTSGHGYVRGDGAPFNPRPCHWGESFSAYVHCKAGTHVDGITLAEWRMQARAIARHYDAIRNWDVLGYYSRGWRGREVTPIDFVNDQGDVVQTTPQYYGEFISWMIECETAGLKVMLDRGDLNTWREEDRLIHMNKLGTVIQSAFGRQRANIIIAGLWAVNEANINGLDSPSQAVAMLIEFHKGSTWLPGVVGTADYDRTEHPVTLAEWTKPPATVMTCHPLRDPGNVHRMIGHYFSNGYGTAHKLGVPGFYTEPIPCGPDATVGRIDDPEYIAALTAAGMIGGCAYTYTSSPGIFFRAPNIHEQPGFLESSRLMSWLPDWLMHAETVAHSGTSFIGTRILVADDSIGSRNDYAIHGDQFVSISYAQRGVAPMVVERSFQGHVVEPHTLTVVWSGSIQRGEMLPMAGRIARLVIGTFI